MPEAKSKARLRISESRLNLCDQPPPKGVDKSSSMYMRIDNTQTPPCGDQVNQRESPLNLVMNTKYSNQNLGMKCSPVPVSAPNKTTPPSREFNSNDISSPESMTVPKNPVNKLNYFPKSVSNFQDLGPPVTPGHFWQRIGPYHYNSNTSGAPLVAFVNPTATSVIPHGLKPDFSAPNTIPNVDSMNPIVYTPMPSSKSNLNLNQHLPAPMILVRSSLPLSKPGNFQYVMNPTEKGASSSSSNNNNNNNNNNNKSSSSSSSFSKSSPQAIFGNESGKFIPVATIVPNNASLVTNSQKTVTSILPGESILSTNQFKSSDFERRKSMPDSSSIKSKAKCPNSNSALWYSTLNSNRNPPMNLQPSSSSADYFLNTKAKPHYLVSQPLNLTLQSASDFSNRSSPQNPDTTGKQKNFTMLPPSSSSSQSPEMRFRPTNTNPSSVLFNYSFPNQNVYMPNPAHLNKGLLSRSPFENKMAALNSKVHSRASYGHSINLSEGSRHFPSLRLPTQSAEKSESASPNDDEPPMTLRIDSIFSLAEKPATETAEQTKQKTKPSPKTKTKAPNKLACKDKNLMKKAGVSSSKSCNRRSPKDRKRPVKKLPKSTHQRSNNSLEIKNSVLSRKTPTQNHDITVSCHASDFKALHPMTEEERKLNTFFRYLGLRPSSSLNSEKSCNGANVGQGNSTDDRGNVSKELARCFNCYVVVPMFQVSEDFVSLDVGNPPASFKTMENCSKACRHEFLIQQRATSTGIVTRSAEFDSSWKIVSQSPNCPHTRKKYCRKSKTKASGNFTGSHCRRFGCIGCSTRRPTASPTTTNSSSSHNKMKYFRRNAKEDSASKLLSTNKDSSNMAASPHSKEAKKKSYALNKKTNSDKNYSTEKSVKDSIETDSKCHNVLVEKNNSAFRKRKTSQDCHGNNKVLKKDINEMENVINNSLDILEAESVDEVSPLVSNFLDIEDSCHTESRLLPVKKTGVSPETVFLPANDTSASSERIQRLKEILKEKQKDLEIARQLLL